MVEVVVRRNGRPWGRIGSGSHAELQGYSREWTCQPDESSNHLLCSFPNPMAVIITTPLRDQRRVKVPPSWAPNTLLNPRPRRTPTQFSYLQNPPSMYLSLAVKRTRHIRSMDNMVLLCQTYVHPSSASSHIDLHPRPPQIPYPQPCLYPFPCLFVNDH